MTRLSLTMLLGAALALGAGCVESDDRATATTPQAAIGDPCDYITCGRNTKDVGNGIVDQVYFDGTANQRGQRFVSWKTAGGVSITPRLTARTLYGLVDGQWQLGPALVGSVLTLEDADQELTRLRITDARRAQLPNGVAAWTYRIAARQGSRPWRPLCELFDHAPSEIARFALLGTREVVHARGRHVTAHEPVEGRLTLGCPSSATGKMLSLGALATTAAHDAQPTLAEANATLLALTLTPTGARSYTRSGIGVMFHVVRTGVDNNGESLSGGIEGAWDADGAICFDRLRIGADDLRWALWTDTHVPSCSQVDLDQHEVLVWTHRYFGVYPAYPPVGVPPDDFVNP